MTYQNVGEWIKREIAKKSFKDIKAYEKIMRTLAKNGEIERLSDGRFVYTNNPN